MDEGTATGPEGGGGTLACLEAGVWGGGSLEGGWKVLLDLGGGLLDPFEEGGASNTCMWKALDSSYMACLKMR